MGNWLQKVLSLSTQAPKSGSLPAARKSSLPAQPLTAGLQKPKSLPNATVIYGIGASLLFAAAFLMILQGRWFTGLLVFILGCGLTGFALHLLKHQD
jgi:hypothetical protein